MMQHMQNASGGFGGVLPLLFGIHGLGMIVLLVGIVFLIVWGVRNLTADKLKTWGIALSVIGAILSLLTIDSMHPVFGGRYFGSADGTSCDMMKNSGMMMKNKMNMGMMEDMMDDDDAMNMSMHDMSAMLEGKTGDDFDRAFLEGMIPHHQGAIDMARAAKENAKHAEIKKMADDIMSTQQNEINQMNQWLKEWGYTK